MISAFGVDHGMVSKAAPDRVPDSLTPALPGSTVAAYNRSKQHKTQAAGRNFAAKTIGGAAGFAAGAALTAKLGRKSAFLTTPTKVLGRVVSAERKVGLAQSTVGGAVGGAAGGVAGARSLKRIKRDPKYGYR